MKMIEIKKGKTECKVSETQLQGYLDAGWEKKPEKPTKATDERPTGDPGVGPHKPNK